MKRAITDEQKREIIERLYKVWVANPELRLGQLINNSLECMRLFYIEDYDFIEEIEK